MPNNRFQPTCLPLLMGSVITLDHPQCDRNESVR